MKIMIANVNKDIILQYLPKAKFTPSTANTCTFIVQTKTFTRLLEKVREDGFNPYGLMYW